MKNIYQRSYEIGRDKLKEGVSYNEMKILLLDEGYPLNNGFENYYKYWFFTHFFVFKIYGQLRMTTGMSEVLINQLKDSDLDSKAIMTGDSLQNLVDFEELNQARINASNAQANAISSTKKATISIKIAIVALAISIVFSLVNIYIYQLH
jgi:hypothetical protein